MLLGLPRAAADPTTTLARTKGHPMMHGSTAAAIKPCSTVATVMAEEAAGAQELQAAAAALLTCLQLPLQLQ